MIDREPARLVEEWSDAGAYVVLADVPEQRVRITVKQEVARDDVPPPVPGDLGLFTVFTAPAAVDSARKRVTASVVVLSVSHMVLSKRAVRTVVMAAVSADGASDPVAVSDAA